MNSSKIIGMKAVVFAVAAAALAAGAVRADEIEPGANNRHTNFGGTVRPTPTSTHYRRITLLADNQTGGCVRVYASGRHNLTPGEPLRVVVVPNVTYQAAVYKGSSCSGKPFKSVPFTPLDTSKSATWHIR